MGNRKGDIEMGHRMIKELLRIYGSKSKIVRNFGCAHLTLYGWEMGNTPGGAFLAKLHYAGGDVIWVLTGRRVDNG